MDAGLDPERFWSLTPRQFLNEMRSAGRRRAHHLADLAEAAYVGSRYDHKELQAYCDGLRGHDRMLPEEALPDAINMAASGLPKVTWSEFLAKGKN